jgi:hypothetical protein
MMANTPDNDEALEVQRMCEVAQLYLKRSLTPREVEEIVAFVAAKRARTESRQKG